jgi:iron complex outermembrane receptor protein
MKHRLFTLSGLAMAISMQSLVVQAQAESDTVDLQSVIITGSRVQEHINEVPASVSILTQEQLENDLMINAELSSMLAIRVPGMSPSTGTTSNFAQTLRGRNALVLIDGVPQSTPLRHGKLGIRSMDAGSLQRIEVIKGATSIYGNGAAGGVINYITKTPRIDKEFNADVGISTNFSVDKSKDTLGKRVNATVDGGIDDFSYLVSGVIDANGVQRDAEGDAISLLYGLSDFESKNLLTKLGYQINDSNAINMTHNYYEGQQKSDYVSVNGNINSGIKSYAIKNGETEPGDPQGPRGNTNLMIKYTSDYLFGHTDFSLDYYKQEIENVFFYSTKFKDSDLGLEGGQSMIKSNKQGLRANFNTQIALTNDIEAGFTYGLDSLNDVTSQKLIDGRFWSPETDMNNVAAYLQTKLVFNDSWVVKAGVRGETIDIQVDDYSTLKICKGDNECIESVDVKGGKLDYTATTYNLGLRYSGDESFSPFVSYSEGFNIADLGLTLRSTTAPDLAQVDTRANIVKNYELGFTSVIDDWRFEFATFRSTSELGTSYKEDSVSGVFLPQKLPQKVWGYEAAVDYTVSNYTSVGATYSWVEGKNTDSDEYLDGELIGPPKFTAYMDMQASENWQLGLTLLAVGDRTRFDANEDGSYGGRLGPVKGYEVINLTSSYQMGNTKLYGGIENLLNEDYYPARSQVLSFTGYNTKGRGRWVTLGVNHSF